MLTSLRWSRSLARELVAPAMETVERLADDGLLIVDGERFGSPREDGCFRTRSFRSSLDRQPDKSVDGSH